MAKRKVILHLASDEVAIKWDLDSWKHMVDTYEALGQDSPEEDKWYWEQAAAYIRESLEAAYRRESWENE